MKSNKVLVLVALIVGVAALAIGFAAYTATLTISSATANVTATNTFNVSYTGTPICYATGDSGRTSVGTAGTASGQTWSGISVPLSSSSKSITCEAQIKNNSTFIAYLKTITSSSSKITCAASSTNGATQNLDTACSEMQAQVTVLSNSVTVTKSAAASGSYSSSNQLAAAATSTVTVVIKQNGSTVTDGNFVVTVPAITMSFSTTN